MTLNEGSARGWDETGIPVPGCKIPGWDRDRDEFSGISGIRDGTGMSFGKPGWDRDAPLNPGIPAIPDLFEIDKNSGKKCECRTIKVSAYN